MDRISLQLALLLTDAAGPRTLIVGDSIIRNIRSRTTTTCCFPQATISDVNKELWNIRMKHKTANRIIIHVGVTGVESNVHFICRITQKCSGCISDMPVCVCIFPFKFLIATLFLISCLCTSSSLSALSVHGRGGFPMNSH